MALTVYYDGECPLCSRYTTKLRLDRQQKVVLVDLRADPKKREELAQGFDLDRGMVVEHDGRRLGGSDAIHLLALLSTPSNHFNRLNRALLSHSVAATILYPLLRSGRWLILLLLGREMLVSSQANSARQAIFTTCFALFSIFHFCNYATAYGRFPPGLDQLLLLASAVLAFCRPRSSRALFLLMLVSTVSAVIQAPAQSNHTITRNFLVLGYWLSFLIAMSRNRPMGEIFGNFTMAGQAVLLVMYFFGIFHKINSGFLNPETSCAVALWEQLPAPLNWISGLPAEYAAIYGTFVVEGGIAMMLIARRWRHYGIAAGIAFHLLLAMSSYAMYIAFTVLSIAMHSLFLSNGAARNILNSKPMMLLESRSRDPVYIAAAIVFLLLLGMLAFNGAYGVASLFAMPLVLPYCWVILRYGRSEESATNREPAGLMVGLIVLVAFFANCAMPYFGLKTAQALNMFANLRLEQGISNHLIFSAGRRPFDYLEHIAMLKDGGSDKEMQNNVNRGFGIVYYDVLAFLADHPDKRITFTVDGKPHHNVSAQDLRGDIALILHPRWFRKWFHFQPVQLDQPERCSI